MCSCKSHYVNLYSILVSSHRITVCTTNNINNNNAAFISGKICPTHVGSSRNGTHMWGKASRVWQGSTAYLASQHQRNQGDLLITQYPLRSEWIFIELHCKCYSLSKMLEAEFELRIALQHLELQNLTHNYGL